MPQSTLQNIFENFLSSERLFVNKNAVSTKYSPINLPHRDEQINNVAQIMSPSLRNEKPSNLFVFGKTGTGKTASIQFVCRQLADMALRNRIDLKCIYINCKMRKVADTEYRLIAQLSREFGEEVPATGLPTDEIYKQFFKAVDSKNQTIVLVLDEVDNLVKKAGDSILYSLTRINADLKNANLVVIGISNDISFINQLDSRVKSSLNEEELIFPPYDALQLKDILSERAKVAFIPGAISEEVISKCAAYAARDHGDARRAIDLLRVAGEIAERQGKKCVEEIDVDLAEEKIERDNVIEVSKKLPMQSQVVLLSAIMLHQTHKPPIYTGELFHVYKSICVRLRVNPLTQRRVSDLISELDMLGILNVNVVSMGRYGRTREITLAVHNDSVDKIKHMFEDDMGLS